MLNVRAIKELVREHRLGISPRRRGQHFLVDPRVLTRIAQTVAAEPGDQVLEIGAGLGALTELLLPSGARLTAVERDPRFVKVLGSRFSAGGGSAFGGSQVENFVLVHSDVLRLDLADYAQGQPHSLIVAGNLPYSITSRILEFLLRHRVWVKRAVLTVQKEVAQRIVSQPNTKLYSPITLLVQVAFRPSIAFQISPGAFYPQPKVTSAVLRLDPLLEPVVPPEREEAVLKLARLIFTHRRKTLLNALCIPGVGLTREEVQSRLREAGIDPIRRPETLRFSELTALERSLTLR